MSGIDLPKKSEIDDEGIDGQEASTIDALCAEISTLTERNRLEMRRLEIASYQAEFILASRLRQANLELAEVKARLAWALKVIEGDEATGSPGIVKHGDRGFLGRLLFRRDGKPCTSLRFLLFAGSGRPRRVTRTLVVKKNGMPRRRFRQWMASSAYQNLPDAHKF